MVPLGHRNVTVKRSSPSVKRHLGERLICSPGWRTSGFAQNHAVPDPQCPVLGGVHLPGAAHTAHTAETPPGRSEGSHRWALGKQGPGHVLNGSRRLQTNCRDSARGRPDPGRTSPPRALAPPLGTPFCGVYGREGGTETSRVVGFGPSRDLPTLSGKTGPRHLQKPSISAPRPPSPATAWRPNKRSARVPAYAPQERAAESAFRPPARPAYRRAAVFLLCVHSSPY